MSKPSPTSYPGYFQRYIDQVPEQELFKAFENQLPVMHEFLSLITEERSGYAYAEGKWTLKEVLQHMIDTERIFAYRALCFARKEMASLPGFEENDYAANSKADGRKWKGLVNEFLVVRWATEYLFGSFDEEQLESSGTANGKSNYVLAFGFIIIGHINHHMKVIKKRYLNPAPMPETA